MSSIIEVENISKQFIIGHEAAERYTTLRDEISKKTKKIFSFANGESRVKLQSSKEVFFALRDVSFRIEQGDRLGIIGRNGAGKSTLLKILSRITEPTSGTINYQRSGCAVCLKSVRAFILNCTGRENIFLNGAILGMSRTEIRKKFDEIVAFAEIEKFLDTPVKRYSSGMYVRLAFAVAAHLEPEILIVDEVLAVGDMEFQKKALGKMKDVSNNEGRTVLFVSHNMQAISMLTRKSVFLDKGKLIAFDSTTNVIKKYLEFNKENKGHYEDEANLEVPKIVKASIKTSEQNYIHINGDPFEAEFNIFLPYALKNGAFAFQILNYIEVPIVHCWIFNTEQPILNKIGKNVLRCKIPKLRLYMGSYKFRLILADSQGKEILQIVDNVCNFQVEIFTIQRDYTWEPNACAYLEDNVWEFE